MRRSLLASFVASSLALGLLLTACSTEVTPDEAPALSAQAVANDYVISARGKLKKGFAEAVAANGDVLKHYYPDAGFAVVTTSNPDAYGSYADIVAQDMVVEWTAPVEQVALDESANPPFSGDDDFFFDLQWGHDAVNAPEAWAAGVRGAGVRVAILDGGTDVTHPDLAPNTNLALSTDFTGQGLAYCPSNPASTFSHAAHVGGTVAAADNAFGTIGVAPEAELVFVKVLSDVPRGTGCTGSGSFGDVIAGIYYAASIDADVINMSLGAAFPNNADTGPGKLTVAMSRATTYAYQHGTTVIASAGNDANDGDHDGNLLHVPSDSAHVISISATAPIGWAVDPANTFLSNLASYSNYGQSAIDFSAPGGDFVYPGNELCTVAGLTRPCWVFDLVFSTGNGGWYWSAGTSMAAPHASGVAALIISENGGSMKPAQVERELRARGLDLGKPGNDDVHGNGAVTSGYGAY